MDKIIKINKKSRNYIVGRNLYSQGMNLLKINKSEIAYKKIFASCQLSYPPAIYFVADYEFFVNNNIVTAINLYETAAGFGDIQSLRALTNIYINGYNVQQNITKANEYIELRAKLGDPEGYNELGINYIDGIGKEINYRQGIKYFEKAAKKKSLTAYINLARTYFFGKGVKPDEKKTFSYYKLAAETKHPEGYFRLGCAYLWGIGVTKNIKKAITYLTKAAKDGHILSCTELGDIYHTKRYKMYNRKLSKLWYDLAKKYTEVKTSDDLGEQVIKAAKQFD